MYVIKKDGRREAFDPNKIKSAVNKSAERVMVEVDDNTHKMISDYVAKLLQEEYENSEMKVENMTSAEVAEILKMNSNTVRTKWNRLLAKIKRIL